MSITTKRYSIYARRIQNSLAGEKEFVGTYEGYNKQDAVSKAMNAPENRGLYVLDSYFAICRVWWFEQNK